VRIEETAEFHQWLAGLRDTVSKARILVRIDRLAHGNPGRHRYLSHGVRELKVDVGPGYRVYYLQRGQTLIVLLAGGDKSTQRRDVALAVALAQVFDK
jgi:putative addiction module killer protein